MSTLRAGPTDDLHPDRRAVAAAWAERVLSARRQASRVSEVGATADAFESVAGLFSQDPSRTGDEALERILARAEPADTWLDIGAGGGRYALPLARRVERVVAVEPSSSMRRVLQADIARHGIETIDVVERGWPEAGAMVGAIDVALIAHVGYDTEAFDGFIDAADRIARRRCVVVMRSGSATAPGQMLWPEIHGEPRIPVPVLPGLLLLLLAREVLPEVALVERSAHRTYEGLVAVARRQLRLRPGSEKDQRLQAIIAERAVERDGGWALDTGPTMDGVVTWLASAAR